MDGAVLSAPYDSSDAERRPAPRGSSAPPTEILNAPKVTVETSPPLQSTIRAPAPQAPTLPSDKETHYSQGEQNRSPKLMRWAILAILLILWLFGLIVHIGGGLIHSLLLIAVIVLIYSLVASRRSV